MKYALQERDALQEMLKEKTYEWFEDQKTNGWFGDLKICGAEDALQEMLLSTKREQLIELRADLERAREEVSDIELLIWREEQAEHGMVLLQLEEEELLRQQEWMDAMDQAYEEGYFMGD